LKKLVLERVLINISREQFRQFALHILSVVIVDHEGLKLGVTGQALHGSHVPTGLIKGMSNRPVPNAMRTHLFVNASFPAQFLYNLSDCFPGDAVSMLVVADRTE
jgi:hypothetical protein